jgi:hypothetical protein
VIICFGEENMNSYEENEMRRLCALRKTGARLFALAPSIKRNVLRCAAGKATLLSNSHNFNFTNRVALRARQRKFLRFMKNASPKMRLKPCVLKA